MLFKIVKAEYLGDFKLALEYDNGAKVISDMKPALKLEKRKVFEPIKNEENFKTFKLSFGTVVWGDELDIAPEFLLCHSQPQANDTTSLRAINYAKSLYEEVLQ
jgi:Protein of unknown function (DUF2442)